MKLNQSRVFPVIMILIFGIVNIFVPNGAVQATGGFQASAEETTQIDKFVETMMDKLQLPGVAIGIVRGDQPLYLKGYGVTGPQGQPVTAQTPFILGSSTKSFTALAIIQLVEQGKVDLEAPVRDYLPQFEIADREASGKILVKHLLNQNSGLSTYTGRLGFAGTEPTIEELIRGFKDTPLSEPVGTTYQYSNANYDILGGIVQSVSGMSYADYVRKNIFELLDMKNSFTSTLAAKKHGLASGYQSIFGYMFPTEQPDNPSMLASAYLISSAEDMAHYLISQLNDGNFGDSSVASAESIRRMHEPAVPDPTINGHYGMGWEIADGVVRHQGDIENFHSSMVLDGDTGIIVLINAHDYLVRGGKFEMITDGIRDILHGRQPQTDVGSVMGTHLILDLVCLAVAVLLGISVVRLFKRKVRIACTPLRNLLFVLFLLLFNFAIPVVVLYGAGRFVASWRVVCSFLPGLGHLVFLLCILALGIGVVKLILFVGNLRRVIRI
ncbi:serine hydrolase domain-containing protein [Paenibacillus faecis]|nr:serine hydrolase domain-containing protein [Paenibacillus faecis]